MSALFIAPHFALGVALLLATFWKKVWIRGLDGNLGLVVQAIAGAVFFLAAGASIVTDLQQTTTCRAAAETRNAEVLEGPIVITERFNKPGYSYIRFSVAGHALRTETVGVAGDCGYLQPLGKSARIIEGQTVRVHALGTKVVSMERVQ